MQVNDNVQGQLLQVLAKSSSQAGAQSGERAASQMQLNPGQQVKAEILANLSNHLYLARVAGELFKLEIPLIVQPGQSVPLTFVTAEPRVLFEVRRQQEGGESVRLSFHGKRLGGENPLHSPLDEVLREAGAELPEDLLAKLWQEAGLPSPDEEQAAVQKLGLEPGQQLKGEVLRAVAPELYLVKAGGETFKLALPQGLQAGEKVSLTFVTADPQVLFELQRSEGGAEPVRLSTIGKWLAQDTENSAALRPSAGPLAQPGAQDAALLAARLREALTSGGLFYESHLAKWAAGSLPLQELLKEPQGTLSKAAGKGRAPAGSGEGIGDDRTLPLVREQLSLLHTGTLTWKGEAWPDQEMALTVRQRPPHEEEPGVEANLKLELPHLGGVQVRLTLGGLGLSVELVARQPESCELLSEGRDELLAAGAKAGLSFNRVMVRYGEPEK